MREVQDGCLLSCSSIVVIISGTVIRAILCSESQPAVE